MRVLDQRNLPDDRPASMDESGRRVFIFPASVSGFWRRNRTILEIFLIIFFLTLPWIKIGGHQALLLNIGDRQFSIFGLTFWAHDAPLIFFILAFLTIGLAFVTAVSLIRLRFLSKPAERSKEDASTFSSAEVTKTEEANPKDKKLINSRESNTRTQKRHFNTMYTCPYSFDYA